jgi:AcrR family transcriptional regulator
MAKPRGKNADNREAMRARILASGRQLFEASGFGTVTTAAIATDAGASEGTLFHHFASKRELFIEVHNHWQDELVARIDRAAARATNPAERFSLIWRSYLDSTQDPGMRQVLLLDGPNVIGLDALRARDRQTAFAFFRTELEELMAVGAMRRRDSQALAILLFGALDQAAFEIADFPDDHALRQRLVEGFQALIDALS